MATAKKAAAKKAPAKKAPAKKAAAKKSATKSSRFGPAIQLLIDDHEAAKAIFEEYETLAENDGSDEEKKALAEQVCAMLTAHTTIEEELFYPAAREALGEDGEDLLDEAEVEHASAKDLIAQIQSMEPSEDLYDAKVKVLGEYVNHHVEEEESEMFPKCQKADMDQDGLAEQMSERKDELLGESST